MNLIIHAIYLQLPYMFSWGVRSGLFAESFVVKWRLKIEK